jgi:hypothetical protein
MKRNRRENQKRARRKTPNLLNDTFVKIIPTITAFLFLEYRKILPFLFVSQRPLHQFRMSELVKKIAAKREKKRENKRKKNE